MGTLTDTNPTPLPQEGWRLTFYEGFNSTYLDRAAWPLVSGGGSSNGAYTFQPGNIAVWDGAASVNNVNTPYGWTSGAFQQGWNGQLYGRYEIRARLDPGQGLSGAILLWPTDNEVGPEVDLIETRTADRTLNNISVHGDGGFDSWEFRYDASQWHTYAVDWLPDQLIFYLDGQEIHRTANRVPDEPMSLGFLGYVNSQTDLWQGGPPNASSPGFNSMEVDWVRIYTPENLYPGAPPAALYGQPGALRATTEPWTGTWVAGNRGEYARSGVRSDGATTYAATWNAAGWNDPQMGLVVSAPTSWDPSYAGRLLYANFVEVFLDFGVAGPANGVSLVAAGSQRGTVKTGAGNDGVTWIAHSAPAAGTNNVMNIGTGEGNDGVTVMSVAQSGTDEPYAWGPDWQPGYNGLASTARVGLGNGDDTATLWAGSGVVDGGAGADTAAFAGPARTALRWVFPALLRFCECRGWTDGRHDFVLFGLEPDVRMAEWLMHVVSRALQHEEARYRAGPAYAARREAPQAVLRSFRYGFADRLSKRLDEMADARAAAMAALLVSPPWPCRNSVSAASGACRRWFSSSIGSPMQRRSGIPARLTLP